MLGRRLFLKNSAALFASLRALVVAPLRPAAPPLPTVVPDPDQAKTLMLGAVEFYDGPMPGVVELSNGKLLASYPLPDVLTSGEEVTISRLVINQSSARDKVTAFWIC